MKYNDFIKHSQTLRIEIEELSYKENLSKQEIIYLVVTAYNLIDEAQRKSKIINDIIQCYQLTEDAEEILKKIKHITYSET